LKLTGGRSSFNHIMSHYFGIPTLLIFNHLHAATKTTSI